MLYPFAWTNLRAPLHEVYTMVPTWLSDEAGSERVC